MLCSFSVSASLSQMLGVPTTLISLLASADRFLGAVSEDFSVPPTVSGPETPRPRYVYREFHPSRHLPVLTTSIFHPPPR